MAITDPRIRITATDKTKAAFNSAQRNVEGLTSSLLGFRTGLASILGAAGLGAVIKSVSDTGDQIQKLSISLGASTEALSQYRLIAETSGTSLESLGLIWQRQTRRISEAAAGYGEARGALRELGLDVQKLNQLQPDRQFEAIADAMQGVTTQADKLRLAFKLFDSEGARPALQAMEAGGDGLRAMRTEADQLGLTLTRLEADQMAEFNDALTKAKLAIVGAAQQLVVLMGPAITAVANAFATATKWVVKFFDSFRDPENKKSLEGIKDEIKSIQDRLAAFPNSPPGMLDVERLKALGKRYAELTAEVASAGEKFEFTPGGLPAASDTKAAERAAAEEERLREQMARKLDIIRESTLTETELLTEKHEERLFFLEEAYQNELITFQALQEQKAALEAQYQDELIRIDERACQMRAKNQKSCREKDLKGFAQYTQTLIGASATMNRTLFNINKVAAISEALLSFRETVVDAYAWGTKIGGPPLGAAMAAIATAAQLANIAAIASTSFGDTAGGGGGGGASSAVPTYDVDPVFGIPETSNRTIRQDVTINLGDDDTLLSTSAVRNLIDKINEQIDDGVVIGSIVLA